MPESDKKTPTPDRYSKYDNFEGAGAGLTDAYRKHHARQAAEAGSTGPAGQCSHTRFIGTPRKAKHRGGKVSGVTVK